MEGRWVTKKVDLKYKTLSYFILQAKETFVNKRKCGAETPTLGTVYDCIAHKRNVPSESQVRSSVHDHNERDVSLLTHIAGKLFVLATLVLSHTVKQRRRLLKVLFDDVLEDLVPQCIGVA